MTDSIERLTKLFEKFPGIGPRQAGRFVHYLLRASPAIRRELAKAIADLGSAVKQCQSCFRFSAHEGKLCDICANTERDDSTLAVVATDADLLSIERSGTFRGRYFVLGGTLHLGSESMGNLRSADLVTSLPSRVKKGLTEIILAFPANPEGDATSERLRAELSTSVTPDMKITSLGRGLSTGSELEYADSETLRSAIEGRR
jgi:recombination protein RecR